MKTFFKSVAGLILICILGAFIFLFLMWSRVPDMVASYLSKILSVAVEIGDVHLSPSQVTVQNLDIANPRGFNLSHALTTQEITIQAPVTRYFQGNIVIDEIDLNNVYIGLEFDSPKGAKGNWTEIMKNADLSQKKSIKSSSEKTVLIKRLILNNIQSDLFYRSEGRVRHLPLIARMELNNISSKGGDFSDQLMNSALGQMIKEIFVQENLKNALDKIFQQLPGGNDNPVNLFKGLFGSIEAE